LIIKFPQGRVAERRSAGRRPDQAPRPRFSDCAGGAVAAIDASIGSAEQRFLLASRNTSPLKFGERPRDPDMVLDR
jgi:hypothetical protein